MKRHAIVDLLLAVGGSGELERLSEFNDIGATVRVRHANRLIFTAVSCGVEQRHQRLERLDQRQVDLVSQQAVPALRQNAERLEPPSKRVAWPSFGDGNERYGMLSDARTIPAATSILIDRADEHDFNKY